MTESPKFFSISGLQTAANTSTLITRALEENLVTGPAIGWLHEVHRHPAQGGAIERPRSVQ